MKSSEMETSAIPKVIRGELWGANMADVVGTGTDTIGPSVEFTDSL